MPSFIVPIQTLFHPEETSEKIIDRAVHRELGSRSLSWKAMFWCVTAILISLGIGNLT